MSNQGEFRTEGVVRVTALPTPVEGLLGTIFFLTQTDGPNEPGHFKVQDDGGGGFEFDVFGGDGGGGGGLLTTELASVALLSTVATNITTGLIPVDGVTAILGDRIALFRQASSTDNGIYIAASSGTWARAPDFLAGIDVGGVSFRVQKGIANREKVFFITQDDPNAEVGTDNIFVTEDKIFDETKVFSAVYGAQFSGTMNELLRYLYPLIDFNMSTGPGSLVNGVLTSAFSGGFDRFKIEHVGTDPASGMLNETGAPITLFFHVSEALDTAVELIYNSIRTAVAFSLVETFEDSSVLYTVDLPDGKKIEELNFSNNGAWTGRLFSKDPRGVNNEFIAESSETARGVIEIATQTEADVGTDDLKAVTPLKAKTKNVLDSGAATVTVLPANDLIRVNTTSQTVDVDMPDIRLSTILDGQEIKVKDEHGNAGTNNMTINPFVSVTGLNVDTITHLSGTTVEFVFVSPDLSDVKVGNYLVVTSAGVGANNGTWRIVFVDIGSDSVDVDIPASSGSNDEGSNSDAEADVEQGIDDSSPGVPPVNRFVFNTNFEGQIFVANKALNRWEAF